MKGPGDPGGLSPHRPLSFKGDLKLAAVDHTQKKGLPLLCVVHVIKLSPGGGGGGEHDLETQAEPGHIPALRSWANHSSFRASDFIVINSGDHNSHVTERLEELDKDMCA